MGRWLLLCLVLCSAAVGLVGWLSGAWTSDPAAPGANDTPGATAPGQIAAGLSTRVEQEIPAAELGRFLTIPDGRLLVVDKNEVAAEAEGTLLFIATEVKPGEQVAEDRKIQQEVYSLGVAVDPSTPDAKFVDQGGKRIAYRRWEPGMALPPMQTVIVREMRTFRKLSIGDTVQRGDVVGLVNPVIAVDELGIAAAQLDERENDRLAAGKMHEEYKKRLENNLKTIQRSPGAVPQEEIDSLRLGVEKSWYDWRMKTTAVTRSERELTATETKLRMHMVRARTSGIIKMVYKNSGDAIRKLDPLIQVMNTDRLRVESLIGVEQTPFLRRGMNVIVEASRPDTPLAILTGHLQEVTSVAVTNTAKPLVVSGSEDRTIRGWDPRSGRMLWEIGPFATGVRALASGPATSRPGHVLIGVADGSCWLFDSNQPRVLPLEMEERHKAAVNAVAFSPDGNYCVTAGDDRSIILWNVATRKREQVYTGAHRAAITSLSFASPNLLVSRDRDNAIYSWAVQGSNPLKRVAEFDRRSGEVSISNTDGQRILFDQGKELRIQSLKNKGIEGVLQASSGASAFTRMALFSPDGKTILTTGTENKLQLWRTPPREGRGVEIRQYLWNTPSTCGAFSADSAYAVTGTQDGKLLVWKMPSQEEINKRILARLVLVEQSLDSSTMQVRVWAELIDRAEEWLVPGSSATLVVPLDRNDNKSAAR